MAVVKHIVEYCDRCGRDVSTEARGTPTEKGLIRLSWRGRVSFMDGYGSMSVSAEKNDAIDICHNCFLETERFLLNKHHTKEG